METETKRLDFFDQVAYSVQPSKYKELIGQPFKKILGYLLVLSLCMGIMQCAIPAAGWFVSFGGLDQLFTEVLPEIELQDGRLSVENKIELGADGVTHVLIDTERVEMSASDLDTETYISEILVAEENMIIYASGVGAKEMRFSDLGDVTLDNTSLTGLKPIIYAAVALTFLLQVVTNYFDILLWAFMMAVACWGPFRIKGTEHLKFLQIAGLAVYTQTAGQLITAFNSCVNLFDGSYIVFYVCALSGMILLITGLRKMGDKPNV